MRSLSLLWLGVVPATAESPVQRVTKLIQKVADDLAKEAKADQKTYDDIKCWCKKNVKAKQEAVDTARADAGALAAEIKSEAGKSASYKAKAEHAEKKQAEYENQAAEAEENYETDMAELRTTYKNLKEALSALKMAVKVISQGQAAAGKAADGFLQTNPEIVEALSAVTHDVSEKYRILTGKTPQTLGSSFLQASTGAMSKLGLSLSSQFQPTISVFSAQKVLSAFLQEVPATGAGSMLHDPSRGGGPTGSRVLGILKNMDDNMSSDVQKTEEEINQKKASYEELKNTLTEQIATSRKTFEESTAKSARAKYLKTEGQKELQKKRDAATADAEVLRDVLQSCQNTDRDFAVRSKARAEEQAAVAKALEILNDDENKATLLSFLQTRSQSKLQGRLAAKALRSASEAVSQWSEFSESVMDVQQMMAHKKQLALLTAQAKSGTPAALEPLVKKLEELIESTKTTMKSDEEHKVECSDNLTNNGSAQRQSGQDIKNFNKAIEKTTADIEKNVQKQQETHEMLEAAAYSIKEAEQKREEANAEYQDIVQQQNEVMAILRKVEKALSSQYEKVALVERPGEVEAMPASFEPMKKNSAGTGIMAVLSQIILDADTEKKDAIAEEAKEQEDYENFVKAQQEAIKMHGSSIADLMQNKADLEEKQEANHDDLASQEEEQKNLETESAALHEDCDFLLKYHAQRKEAMGQEIAGMTKAIAILSGASFAL